MAPELQPKEIMKPRLIDRVASWTHRNLKWMVPLVAVGTLLLWWWWANIDAIGHWLWQALHGQKALEIELAAVGTTAAVLGAVVMYFLILGLKK